MESQAINSVTAPPKPSASNGNSNNNESSAKMSVPPAASSTQTREESTSQNRQSSAAGPGAVKSNVRGSDSKHFSRGKGDLGRGGHKGKKRDMGRNAWSKQKGDKRKQIEDEKAKKRQRTDDGGEGKLPIYATKFSAEEVKAEDRRPKKKVAVMIGYSGTGYKGMQMTHDQKTIEGDLFKAFVLAGAISKANADDPKKSSFVRCARTDKGVHAAGNVISLKLIVEDEDIVQKINDNLTPQIRIWGIERTNNTFSAYQLVDSRIYEYLIPSHSFLPPHPSSYMGRKCHEWALKKGELEKMNERQKEVEGYWEKVDEEIIKPILNEYEDDVRQVLEKALWLKAEEESKTEKNDADGKEEELVKKEDVLVKKEAGSGKIVVEEVTKTENVAEPDEVDEAVVAEKRQRNLAINEGVKKLRQAYVAAKRSYRIPQSRLQRVREALNMYTGTQNYHNYTVDKEFRDASAKRVIKSFKVDSEPILINGTEWLSLKVHGQSFMMHQIRKMVGMVALVVRSGCDPNRIIESYGKDKISIPKAPSLGLLLERPIFDTYNKKAKTEFGKESIDFNKYKKEMLEFKQREIYDRMYHDEEKENIFGNFFHHVDNFPSETFLFVTAGGIEATRTPDGESKDFSSKAQMKLVDEGDDDSDQDEVKDEHGNEG